MTSYCLEAFACPGCNLTLHFMSTSSGNSFGAKVYTDGFIKGPMYSQVEALSSCLKCKTLFWQEDVKTLSQTRHPDVKDFDKHPFCRSVAVADYPEILAKTPWRDSAEEKYCRIRAWWAWNEPHQKTTEHDIVLLPPAQSNLNRLLELLDKNEDIDAISRCEILRELGRFQECIEELDRPYDERYRKAKLMIMTLAKENISSVRLIE